VYWLDQFPATECELMIFGIYDILIMIIGVCMHAYGFTHCVSLGVVLSWFLVSYM
jgi:hypothetical protein